MKETWQYVNLTYEIDPVKEALEKVKTSPNATTANAHTIISGKEIKSAKEYELEI